MLKRFLKDSSIYTFGIMISRGIAFLMVPIYTRLLSPSDYGLIDIITIVSSFAIITFTLEINQGFGRYYSDAETVEEKNIYSSTSVLFVLISSVIFISILFAAKNLLYPYITGKSVDADVYFLAVTYIWCSIVFTFLQNQLRWYLRSKQFAIVSIVFTFLAYTATVILMKYFSLGVKGFFSGMIIGYVIAILLSWQFSRVNLSFNFDFKKLKQMLKFSLPLVPSSVGMIILLYIDRLAIKDLMSLHEVGIFGIAYRFSSVVSLVLAGFQTALAPLIYQNYKNDNTPHEIENIFRFFLIVVLSLALGLSMFSLEVLKLFTTPAYYDAYKIIPFVTFATIFLSLNLFTPGLLLAKKTKYIAAINLLAAVLNTSLNYFLIPVYGINGAGSATLLTSILLFITFIIFNQKYYKIPYKYFSIISSFIFILILILSDWFILKSFDEYSLRISLKILIWMTGVLFLSHYLWGIKNIKISIAKVAAGIKLK